MSSRVDRGIAAYKDYFDVTPHRVQPLYKDEIRTLVEAVVAAAYVEPVHKGYSRSTDPSTTRQFTPEEAAECMRQTLPYFVGRPLGLTKDEFETIRNGNDGGLCFWHSIFDCVEVGLLENLLAPNGTELTRLGLRGKRPKQQLVRAITPYGLETVQQWQKETV